MENERSTIIRFKLINISIKNFLFVIAKKKKKWLYFFFFYRIIHLTCSASHLLITRALLACHTNNINDNSAKYYF